MMRALPRPIKVSSLMMICLLLGLLVLKTTILTIFFTYDPTWAPALVSRDTQTNLTKASLLLHQQAGRVSPHLLKTALDAAPYAPTALEPVLITGAAFTAAGDKSRAEKLLLEARRRDPRSALVRVYLVQLFASSGRIAEAAQELAVLANLVPALSGQVFIPQLAFYADDAAHRASYGKVLATHPNVRRNLLLHLVLSGESPDRVIELAARSAPSKRTSEDDAWQMPLVDRLLADRDLDRARSLWLRFTGAKRGKDQNLLYDGLFTNTERPGPFGWRLSETSAGVAEPSGSRGLAIHYYGRDRADLAAQIVLLAPGRYRLQTKVSGDGREGRSAIRWQLACRENNIELLSLPLGLVTSAPSRLGTDFIVPEGCKGQTLILSGTPFEFAEAETIWIHQVEIRPFI